MVADGFGAEELTYGFAPNYFVSSRVVFRQCYTRTKDSAETEELSGSRKELGVSRKDLGVSGKELCVSGNDFARLEKNSVRAEEELRVNVDAEDADKSEADTGKSFQKTDLRFGWKIEAIMTVSTK